MISNIEIDFQKSVQNSKESIAEYTTGLSNNQTENTTLHNVYFQKEDESVGIRSLSQPVLISSDMIKQDNPEIVQKIPSVLFFYAFI